MNDGHKGQALSIEQLSLTPKEDDKVIPLTRATFAATTVGDMQVPSFLGFLGPSNDYSIRGEGKEAQHHRQ